ncbi:unnamed protein product [Adineta steineri]|uniref:CCHC-type domain-containing protein n=3 Tax=Adineta steineri TaxID=433720 RepID=A0A814UBA7_9BILA|nr:unnamed protein product [Adineta steineri]CAF1562202.1 unnamed protein product [Adineta steineri]
MNDPSTKSPRKINPNPLHTLVASHVESNTRNYRTNFRKEVPKKLNTTNPKPLLECIQPEPLLTSKPYEKPIHQRRRKNKPFDSENLARSNDDQVNKPEISPPKTEIGRSTIDIIEPTTEHLLALKNAFNKILSERCLSDNSLKQRQIVFTKLRQFILNANKDCQVNLYGSIYFECCLEKPGVMDIDIQFKETPSHDALKELLDIIKKSDLCKEAQIDTEHKPSFINLIVNEPNMRVKISSGYTRGIYLSKLLRIYTKFDPRVIKLLRLFRILSKTCNTDKPELGTLHPVVFHLMVIHFLQQLDQPVLPCLHEYAYGIDNVPITLNENQYPEFFHVCQKYISEWKSKNTTSVEILFLQLLSYYVKTFNLKQFVVSIQTRMPVMKSDKNWHSRKLLVEDPTDIKRSLCQTMQSMRSIDYFRDTLIATLNYFGRKQKKTKKITTNKCSIENNDDDLIEVIVDDDIPTHEPSKSIHNSYKLFYKRLPPTVARDSNIRQPRVRQYYKQSFHDKHNPLPKGIIQLNSSKDKFDTSDVNDIQEALQHDLENNFEIMDENDDDQNDNHFHLLEGVTSHTDEEDEQELNENFQDIDIEQKDIATRELFPISNEEEPTIENESSIIKNDIEQETISNDEKKDLQTLPSTDEPSVNETKSEVNTIEISSTVPIDIKTNGTTSNDNSNLPSPFDGLFKIEPIVDSEESTNEKDPSTENSIEYFYDFQPENFHAEQGAPYVCTTCNGVGHLKNECPELVLPNVIDLPEMNEKWIEILSLLNKKITNQSKPSNSDIENRQEILNQLEKQFKKDYPDCNLHAFGSFYNGFGFHQSDLDVCIVFKDDREKNNDEVIRIMQRILRAMKSSNTFENVQPVLHAKVPIIRSRHRQLHIEIDISLHNMLAIENTRLLKTYTDIDPRVSELGYMIKHLAKFCGIGDASRGTLSSYAYIIMLIHFLQQIQPPVLPVLQQLSDDTTNKSSMYKKCSKWNVYFYEDLLKIKEIMKNNNKLSSGALWIEFLRFYTEQFNYEEHIVTIRQIEPLLKHEKGWFRQTIAIEDPFELSHNLAGGLSPRNWTIIRRVFIRARQQFGIQLENIDISKPDMSAIENTLFNIDELCPTNAPKRCEWCKGPYHIRKRCPKLAALANENEKKRRTVNHTEQQSTTFVSNNYRDNSYYYSNKHQNQYSNNSNGYNYPKSASVNQRSFRYDQKDSSNSTYYSNEYRSNNSHRSYQQNSNNNRACFNCGNFDHIKVHCPLLSNNNSIQRQKSHS